MKIQHACAAALILLLAGAAFAAGPGLDAEAVARQALADRSAEFGLRSGDIDQLRATDVYQSRHSGVWHVWLQQTIDGRPVALGLANANIDKNGRVLSLHSRMSPNIRARLDSAEPQLGALEAIDRFARVRGLDLGVALVPVRRLSDESLDFREHYI